MPSESGFKLGTQAFMEKLKSCAVLIGHEKCASSTFCERGTLVICALHGYKDAVSILHLGTHYAGCPDCVQAFCTIIPAKTEETARGYYDMDVNPEGE